MIFITFLPDKVFYSSRHKISHSLMCKQTVPVFSALFLPVGVLVRSCNTGPVAAATTDAHLLSLRLHTLDTPHSRPHLSWPGLLYEFWLIYALSTTGSTSSTAVPRLPFKTQDWCSLICTEFRERDYKQLSLFTHAPLALMAFIHSRLCNHYHSQGQKLLDISWIGHSVSYADQRLLCGGYFLVGTDVILKTLCT